MKTLRIGFLLLISTGALVAGEVTTAFRTLVARARSVRVQSVPYEKGEKVSVVEYSTTAEISQIAAAFDFGDPQPSRMEDGTLAYGGRCKCLPTHYFIFTLRDGSKLELFLNAKDLKDIGVDVKDEDVPRMKMPWVTTLGLTPVSNKTVAGFLKSSEKKEANQ